MRYEVQQNVWGDKWRNYYNGLQFETYADALRAYLWELTHALEQYDEGIRSEPLFEEYLAVAEVEDEDEH